MGFVGIDEVGDVGESKAVAVRGYPSVPIALDGEAGKPGDE
jgi:hypothetical protein